VLPLRLLRLLPQSRCCHKVVPGGHSSQGRLDEPRCIPPGESPHGSCISSPPPLLLPLLLLEVRYQGRCIKLRTRLAARFSQVATAARPLGALTSHDAYPLERVLKEAA
jgi:hypothetical protein